jgi:hypothetical protein
MMAVIAPFRSGTVNDISFVGVGNRTATVRQIKDRFNALRIHADWERFDHISQLRNEVEHLFPSLDQKGLQRLIADAFIVASTFIRNELNLNPSNVLGQKTWLAMLEVNEVHDRERRECDELLAGVVWRSAVIKAGVQKMACPECASDLLEPFEDSDSETWLECRSCASNFSPRVYEWWAVMTEMAAEESDVEKLGREKRYRDCPTCGNRAYVMEEKQCAWCLCRPGPTRA